MVSRQPAVSNETLDGFVLQHLQSRGFTDAAKELAKYISPADNTAHNPSRPALVQALVGTMGIKESYEALRDWVDGSLEAFRPELRAVLFPFFVHCYLELIEGSALEEAATLLRECQDDHALFHRTELNLLSQVTAPSQLTTHEFAKRVRGRSFELSVCAQTRSLLVHFLQQGGYAQLLAILNRHITLNITRLSLRVDATDAEAVAARSAASAASQLWVGLSAEQLRAVNSAAVPFGLPLAILEKHEEIANKLGVPPPHATLLPARAAALLGQEAADDAGNKGKGKGGKAAAKRAAAAGGGSAAEVSAAEAAKAISEPVDNPSLPLPPLNEKVEKEVVMASRKRTSLESRAAPSAALLTWVDADGDLCAVGFSNDCSTVGCGFSDGLVRLAHLREAAGAKPRKKAKAPASAAAAVAEGETSASGDVANGGAAWDTGTPQDSGDEPSAVAMAEASAREMAVLRGHSGPVYGVAFSRDDLYVLSCSQDGTCRLWGVVQRACLVVYAAHASPVWSVAFAPIGPYFATCGHDRSVRVWRVDMTQPLRLLSGHLSDARCCAFHPNPSLLASGSDDASIRIWDVSTAQCVRLLCHDGHSSSVSCLAISPDGLHLASGGEDRALLLWHLPSAALCRRIQNAHASTVWSVCFSMEGAQIATSAADCTLCIWDCKAAAAPESDEGSAVAGGAALLTTNGCSGLPESNGGRSRSRFLISKMHTKFTPVVEARYTRTNVLLAAGAFTPPAD